MGSRGLAPPSRGKGSEARAPLLPGGRGFPRRRKAPTPSSPTEWGGCGCKRAPRRDEGRGWVMRHGVRSGQLPGQRLHRSPRETWGWGSRSPQVCARGGPPAAASRGRSALGADGWKTQSRPRGESAAPSSPRRVPAGVSRGTGRSRAPCGSARGRLLPQRCLPGPLQQRGSSREIKGHGISVGEGETRLEFICRKVNSGL